MMGNTRRKLSMVGLALVVTLLAAACGGGKTTSNQPSGGGTTQKGGVYRTALSDFGFTDALDPTGEYLGLAWDFLGALSRNLLSFKHTVGAAGNKLYPDLATDVPSPTDNGLTYTFKLKPNIKFGPPVNRAITSKDIEYAFERLNTASLAAQYGFYYNGIVKGMDGKAKTPTKISGIDTPDNQTITFHLTKPTGDFLYRVAMPATSPIPPEVGKCFTKAGEYGRFIISSGPYMIQGEDKLNTSSCSAMKPFTGFDPTKKLYMVRNPNWDASTDNLRSAYVDGIKIDIDTNVDDIFNKVQSGALDGSLADVPSKTTLRTYLTDPSKKQYLHLDPGDRTWYIFLNFTQPPFDDVHVRKAVNFVMDKSALFQAWGGASSGQIATHIMPPTLLNNTLTDSFDPYATPNHAGDVNKAKDEMKQSKYDSNKDGTCDASVCRNLVMINRNTPVWANMEPVVVQSLGKIGIQVKPRELATSAAYTTIQTVKNNIPIGLNAGWGKDYADPYTFVGALFDGRSIIPTGNTNYSLVGLTASQASSLGVKIPPGAQIPSVDSDIDACETIPVTQGEQRTSCFANLDKKLMTDVVPWVPYLWNLVPTITAPSTTHYDFDQFSGQISLVNVAVNNKQSLS
jgi:peptide/nickel transport system substrate-binding protein